MPGNSKSMKSIQARNLAADACILVYDSGNAKVSIDSCTRACIVRNILPLSKIECEGTLESTRSLPSSSMHRLCIVILPTSMARTQVLDEANLYPSNH